MMLKHKYNKKQDNFWIFQHSPKLNFY